MGAFIHHAAYPVNDVDWYVDFFKRVFDMDVDHQQVGPDGLRKIWLVGGVQLNEDPAFDNTIGKADHLCLIVDSIDDCREKALANGASALPKYHWVKLPDGLKIELYPAAPGAVEALRNLKWHTR